MGQNPIPANSHNSTTVLSRYRVLWHVIFWVWLYVIDVLIFGIGYQNYKFIIYALVEMPGQVAFAYFVMYWVMPRYFIKGRYWEATVYTLALFFVIGVVGHGIAWTIQQYNPTIYANDTGWWGLPKIMLAAFYCFLKACIFIVIKLVMMWYENERRVNEMQKSRLESELKMLKDQVNPHFMFNTLNNLYGLIQKNPLHAQESVLGLSGILRYMLYESNCPTVPLQQEIKCIRDYIELEKLRYPGNLSVSLNVQKNVEDLSILPLSLFPFVENSFKHGASEIIKDAWINIDISTYKNDFVFKIENSTRSEQVNSNKQGIGLSNVKRRLELTYNDDHSLQIIDGADGYLVILKISLSRMNTTNAVYENEMSYR